jgi:HK97 family phage major capsid protein
MLNDASVKVIRKLKDSQNRPLWEPSVQVGQPDMLLGFPVKINNDIATMAASARSILFGDFSKYKIRQVLDTQVARLNERLMDKLQVGFIGFLRAGGALLDAGTHPVVYYANSAT